MKSNIAAHHYDAAELQGDMGRASRPKLRRGLICVSQLADLHQTTRHTVIIAQVHARTLHFGAQLCSRESGHAASVCAGYKTACTCNSRSHPCVHITFPNSHADSRSSVAPSDCCHIFPDACLRRFGLGRLPVRGTLSSLQTAFRVAMRNVLHLGVLTG